VSKFEKSLERKCFENNSKYEMCRKKVWKKKWKAKGNKKCAWKVKNYEENHKIKN